MADRLEKLKSLAAKNPDDPFRWYGVGMEYQKQGEEEEAIRLFRKLVEDHPDYVPTYYQLGSLLISAGEADEAREVLEQGLKLARSVDDGKAVSEIGALLEEM